MPSFASWCWSCSWYAAQSCCSAIGAERRRHRGIDAIPRRDEHRQEARAERRAQALGAVAYGTEAMHVMRAEKGYVIVGQETDGTVTPDDLGLGGMVAMGKPDFVGRRSLSRPDLVAPGRKQLVGLATEGRTVLEEGAQITPVADPARGTHAIGHVTSAYWSPTLKAPIALALVRREVEPESTVVLRPGEVGPTSARVVQLPFRHGGPGSTA